MREIASPLSGIRSPFGGRVDPYKAAGFRPSLVADMSKDYFRATSRQTFDDIFAHSRLGNATMVDSDGLLKWAPHNLLTYSEDFSNATWTTGGSRSTNTTIAPDGTLTADTLTHSAQFQGLIQGVSLPAGVEHTLKYWVKAGTSNNPVYFGYFDGAWRTGDSVTPNAEWQLATYTFTPSAAVTTVQIAQDRATSGFGSVYIWGAHLYRSDLGGMAPVPADARVAGSTTYVPTTSTAKYLPRRHNHTFAGTYTATGSELVANGGFDADSDWTLGTGWTISGGGAVANIASGFADVTQALSLTEGKVYQLEFEVTSYTSGGVTPYLGNSGSGDADFELSGPSVSSLITAVGVGTYTGQVRCPVGQSKQILFRAANGFVGTIDNISVKEATPDYIDAGTLIETEARTNYFSYSHPSPSDVGTLNNATSAVGLDISGGAALSLTRTTTGTANEGYAQFAISSGLTYTPGMPVCYSARVRTDGVNGAALQDPNGFYVAIDVDGNVSSSAYGQFAGATVNSGAEPIGPNEWFIWGAADPIAGGGGSVTTLWLWGGEDYNDPIGAVTEYSSIQVEQALSPSSTIPTSGSTVTRAADSPLTIAGADVPWPTPRVIGGERWNTPTISDPAVWSWDGETLVCTGDGTSDTARGDAVTAGSLYQVSFTVGASGAGLFQVRIGNTFIATLTGGANQTYTYLKVAADTTGLTFTDTGSSTATIDNISVKEIDPLAVCIQMEGDATGDSFTTLRWYADANNYITQEIGASDFTFEQAASGTVDSVTGGSITSGVNVPFNVASYHGSIFVGGAVSGASLTANETPVALADQSGTDLQIAYDFNGNVKVVRVWVAGVTSVATGDALAEGATA